MRARARRFALPPPGRRLTAPLDLLSSALPRGIIVRNTPSCFSGGAFPSPQRMRKGRVASDLRHGSGEGAFANAAELALVAIQSPFAPPSPVHVLAQMHPAKARCSGGMGKIGHRRRSREPALSATKPASPLAAALPSTPLKKIYPRPENLPYPPKAALHRGTASRPALRGKGGRLRGAGSGNPRGGTVPEGSSARIFP